MPPKKNTSCEDESAVTMAMVTQLLEQQKEVYKEMLNLQQENFKGFIQVMIDGTNKRLDGVIKDVQELKTSLEFTQNKMEEETSGHKEIEAKIKSFESDIMKSKQDIDELLTKLDYIDNQHKRKNIIIDGISDVGGEKWNELELKVQQMFSSNLELDCTKIEMERVQRIGQYQEGGRPRKIMVNLLRLKDKQHILSSVKKLKGTNIYINEDFSGAVQQKRKELWPKLKVARERGERAWLRYDKLVIGPKDGHTEKV